MYVSDFKYDVSTAYVIVNQRYIYANNTILLLKVCLHWTCSAAQRTSPKMFDLSLKCTKQRHGDESPSLLAQLYTSTTFYWRSNLNDLRKCPLTLLAQNPFKWQYWNTFLHFESQVWTMPWNWPLKELRDYVSYKSLENNIKGKKGVLKILLLVFCRFRGKKLSNWKQ